MDYQFPPRGECRMRIMLDTNILISAALFPNGRAAQAFFKALQPPYQPLVCDYVVDELHRKFREKFPNRLTELEAFLFNALSFIKLVPTPCRFWCLTPSSFSSFILDGVYWIFAKLLFAFSGSSRRTHY